MARRLAHGDRVSAGGRLTAVCGICGIAAPPGRGGPDPEVLRAMNAMLRHRGPDSQGEVLDGPAGLAMRRLSIIDLAGGDQPMTSEDGAVHVVANGEIYDHEAHRADLRGRGHAFATRSDVEVIVHLYEERGLAFPSALRGMFAVALWDARRERLVLARDRFGIKPLYYRAAGGELSFASELAPLTLVPGFSRELDV